MRHLEMITRLHAQCNAVPMMVVTSGSRCDLLPSCCHTPPFYGLSSRESLTESRGGSNGRCMSKGSARLSSSVGIRIGHKSLLKFRFQGNSPCCSGRGSNVTGPELYSNFRKVSIIRNPRGKLGKRNQARLERSWSRVHAKGVSSEIREGEIGNDGSGVRQSNIIEGGLKDGASLITGGVNDQGNSRVSNLRHGEVSWDGISNSEYHKIQDLKFSGDLWEGDSGPQVLDLQRMLFWLGYLPKRTELTAYFGLGTMRALQQFQIENGVPGTGAWGSASRQALWNLLSDDNTSVSKEGISVYSGLQQPVSTSAGGSDVGIRVSELLNNMGAQSQEFMSTLSTAPYWRHLPTYVPRNAAIFGLLVGMLVALFGLGYSIVGFINEQQHGQPVRRRVFKAHWRDDLSGSTSAKPKRHLDMFPGLDLPLVGDEDFKYRLRSKSKPGSMDGAGRTDRLILYEGQVLVGDETPSPALPFMSGAASRRSSGRFASQAPPRARSSLNPDQASANQISKKHASNGSLSGQSESKLYRAERNSKLGGNGRQDVDEDRVEELRKAVQTTEKNRQEAMRALAEERQRSLELQVKISRQKETAAALEEEVRVLKESHDALLISLRKKYSSTVAARAAAALMYQNWDTNFEEGSPQTLSF